MKPVMQLIKHDAEKGAYGDCHRAALASILEMPIQDVPHFCDPTRFTEDHWSTYEQRWLRQRNYNPISVFYENVDLDTVLWTTAQCAPDTYAILGGTSRNGTGHSVVICNGVIAHDPSPQQTGIVGPMKDGRFWVTYFGHCRAVRREAIEQALRAPEVVA